MRLNYLISASHDFASSLKRFTLSTVHQHTNHAKYVGIIARIHPLWLHLSYFLALSSIGFLLLQALPMRHPWAPRPSRLDLFFMSVSANTVSSTDTVELESFSNPQLVVLTLLMLLGGEVFTSMLSLLFNTFIINNNNHFSGNSSNFAPGQQQVQAEITPLESIVKTSASLRCLCYAVLGYFVVVNSLGCALIMVYMTLIPTSRAVLKQKGIQPSTFALFTAVSSFANCGFVPTNNNMMAFRTCSGLLLIVGALVLLGNTMYPLGLRMFVWALKGASNNNKDSKEHFESILTSSCDDKYEHLMSQSETMKLGLSACGFVMVQFFLLCCLQWRSAALSDGMNAYQKVIGSLFMSVSARHSGESIVDLSAISPAILTLYVVMMYLPPYASIFSSDRKDGNIDNEKGSNESKKGKKCCMNNLIFSQLACIATFVIVICITERRHLSEDPINFNVFNIVFEVISAYGNVGFTMGYSCSRQLKEDPRCQDSWVGFSGRWTRNGKLTLIAVMIFGRLKKFSINAQKHRAKVGLDVVV